MAGKRVHRSRKKGQANAKSFLVPSKDGGFAFCIHCNDCVPIDMHNCSRDKKKKYLEAQEKKPAERDDVSKTFKEASPGTKDVKRLADPVTLPFLTYYDYTKLGWKRMREAEADAATGTNAKSSVDDDDYIFCIHCRDYVHNLRIASNMHNCSRLEAQEKKPAERDDVNKTFKEANPGCSKDVKGLGYPTAWPYLPDETIPMAGKRVQAPTETAATNAKSFLVPSKDGGDVAFWDDVEEDVEVDGEELADPVTLPFLTYYDYTKLGWKRMREAEASAGTNAKSSVDDDDYIFWKKEKKQRALSLRPEYNKAF